MLDEYVKDFQKRNSTLRVFGCYLHQDEATPHLHIDFIPYVTDWKGKGMDTRVSLKQALKSLGFQGGNKHDTELNQWINHEKEVLAEIANNMALNGNRKVLMRNIWMSIISRRKNGKRKYRNWSRRKNS